MSNNNEMYYNAKTQIFSQTSQASKLVLLRAAQAARGARVKQTESAAAHVDGGPVAVVAWWVSASRGPDQTRRALASLVRPLPSSQQGPRPSRLSAASSATDHDDEPSPIASP